MSVRGLLTASLGLALAMLGFGLWVAAGLKSGAQLPVHWNLAGEADRTAPALVALAMPAVMAIMLCLLFVAIPRLEPLQPQLEASAPVLRAVWIGSLLLMVYVQMTIAAPALGWTLGPDLLLVGMGGLIVLATIAPLRSGVRMIIITALVTCAALVPVIYSWWLARRHTT